jgi:hypothetical protein
MSIARTALDEIPIIQALLASENPSIRYQTRVHLLDEQPDAPEVVDLRNQIETSRMARSLLSYRVGDGTIPTNPYKKWQGPFWTLVSLALIDYPPEDNSLHPLRDQVYDWLFSDAHLKFPRTLIIPGQEDRVRRCAGQEAYAIWFTLKLGIADERTSQLVQRLKEFQWPDGGWNCDKRPEARISSFHETLMPMYALAYYGRLKGDKEALDTAKRAAQVFLQRHLFKSRRNGTVIDPQFTLLTYPFYYHYNILHALVVMAETGFVRDERCRDALDLLLSKRRPDGGFPLERKIFKTTGEIITRGTFAHWGATGKQRTNLFVTVAALHALKAAGRWPD